MNFLTTRSPRISKDKALWARPWQIINIRLTEVGKAPLSLSSNALPLSPDCWETVLWVPCKHSWLAAAWLEMQRDPASTFCHQGSPTFRGSALELGAKINPLFFTWWHNRSCQALCPNMRKVANAVIMKRAKSCSPQWYFPVQVACLGSVTAVGSWELRGTHWRSICLLRGCVRQHIWPQCPSLSPSSQLLTHMMYIHTDGSHVTGLWFSYNLNLKKKMRYRYSG